MKGIVFDIKEFAVYDGPGIRTTVFLKGCPLRCKWCHNPEGLNPNPQLMTSPAACIHCGACKRVCEHSDGCIACGKCIPACHAGLRRIVGIEWESQALAERLLKDRSILDASGGGITFSGGEPLMQWWFVREVINSLQGLNTCIETSGYCSDDIFVSVMNTVNLVMMDIKLVDEEAHRKWTGRGNASILRHVKMLCEGSTPSIIRLPLIPGVNDTTEHLKAIAELLKGAKQIIRVEILPYHQTAGAKYPMIGMDYSIDIDQNRRPNINIKLMEDTLSVPCIVL